MFSASRMQIIVARLCVIVCFVAHLLALTISQGDPAASPISMLSRGETVWLHSAGLLALGGSWVLIAMSSWHRSRSTLWRSGCVLLIASAAMLLYIAIYFASASDAQLFGPRANDPLSVLASLLGFAMGALQSGLRREQAVLASINLMILALWLALIPVIPFLEPQWLGAYERTVGALMLAWTWALTTLRR